VTINDERPDPDLLLQRLNADEAQSKRGRLKIFFGASAGVGKTYAMLLAARNAQAQGIPLVIGIVETHGRSDTAAMACDLPRLPMREVERRGRTLREFDLDAALAFGAEHPGGLVLVDELAHSNTPGSRHPKRWQDVEELLDAGIDVWATMNVQHLESLNDIVSGITGIRVWETVPDRIFDDADEVVVVDLPPDELIDRLGQGKVYLPQQAELASKKFFRKGNLLALRELALRRTADRVDDEMQAYRLRSAVAPVWPNRESLLACVGPGEYGEKIVRSCARLAAQLDVSWHAVHVEAPTIRGTHEQQRDHVLRVLKLAQDLGATIATLSAPAAAPALVRYAREHNLPRLVMGRPSRRWPGRRTLGQAIEAEADDLDVLQVAPSRASSTTASGPRTPVIPSQIKWYGYVAALAVCGATALLATPLLRVIELTNIVMLFLLAVVGVALRYGRGPAVLAAFVGVGLFDFFFVAPRFSFAVSDVEYLLTFTVMLVVALVIGQLTAGLKVQAEAATERERRVRGLYEMSRDLSAALMVEQIAEIGARFLATEFGAKTALLVADDQDRLQVIRGATAEVDMGVGQWAFVRGEAAGRGTDTLPASKCLVLPLKATMRLRGVLAIEPSGTGLLSPELRRVLDTCASLLAISIERIHYIDVAQKTTVQMESERLRNSLLSAISHDLRTPLASLVGLADTLQLTKPPPTGQQQDLVQAIRDSALRINSLVNDLLDMARLESGAVQLNRQWQPLEEVVGSALASCASMLQGRPLRVQLAPDLPLLHLDAVLIERVLVNLLENAAKYTPAHSPIEIVARIEGDRVVVTIDDHGPGLPRGREDAIFDKFERGKKESATPGVGLGLAICRAIMQAHGGRIRGETRDTDGARFVLTLPRGEPPTDDGALPPDGDEASVA
jgi:two-component system sensor histidine kinase KdpD